MFVHNTQEIKLDDYGFVTNVNINTHISIGNGSIHPDYPCQVGLNDFLYYPGVMCIEYSNLEDFYGTTNSQKE